MCCQVVPDIMTMNVDNTCMTSAWLDAHLKHTVIQYKKFHFLIDPVLWKCGNLAENQTV